MRGAASSSRRTNATRRFSPRPQAGGGTGLDGLWADDFHHTVRVALTGERESYLRDFTGDTEELADTLANGWHYRGQVAAEPRSRSAARPARSCRRTRFVTASPTTIRSATGRSANG